MSRTTITKSPPRVNDISSSTVKTVWWRVQDPELRLLSRLDWAASMYYPMLNTFFATFFQGSFPKEGKSIYLRHYDHVRSIVPKENLLEYTVSDGWGPLCRFLGDRVPCEPFPNINDASTFVARSRRRNRMLLLNVALRFGLYIVLAVLFVYGMVRELG